MRGGAVFHRRSISAAVWGVGVVDEVAVRALEDFPARLHVEEFFKFDQDLGWNRADTLNLSVRYGQLTWPWWLHQLRQRLGPPVSSWDSQHLARNLLGGLEGDLRVQGDTIKVTHLQRPQRNSANLVSSKRGEGSGAYHCRIR